MRGTFAKHGVRLTGIDGNNHMKHKTWFRLVIRAVGVAFIGFSLPLLGSQIANLVGYLEYWSSTAVSGNLQSWHFLGYLIGGIGQFALGVYCLAGGKWIVDKCIPSNRPYCPECGYDLSHNAHATQCPECGVALPVSNPL
jgi:hypothetical protein